MSPSIPTIGIRLFNGNIMHKFTWVARGAAARHVLNDGPYFLSTLNRSWNYYNNNSRAKIMLFLLFWYWCSFRVALHMNQFYMYSVVFEWRFEKFKQTHGKHRSSALFFFFLPFSSLVGILRRRSNM